LPVGEVHCLPPVQNAFPQEGGNGGKETSLECVRTFLEKESFEKKSKLPKKTWVRSTILLEKERMKKKRDV